MTHFADIDPEFFFRAFLASPVAVCMTNQKGCILQVNAAFLQLYGYRQAEVIGQNPRILKSGRHSPQVYVDMWRQLVDPDCGHWSGELINRSKAGDIVIVMLSIEAVHHADGPLQGFLAWSFDITKWKRQEQSLIKHNEQLSETNRLKSEMLAITSHDLKAPINAIISRANLLNSSYDVMSAKKIHAHLDGIVESGHKLGRFIDEQLDLAKIESGEVRVESERLSLEMLLRSVVEINQFSADTKNIMIDYQPQSSTRPLYADRIKLEQVFNNLLSNAIKFAPESSRIDVSCCLRGESCCVEIGDQGPGIPVADQGQIFDRFYQARRQGGAARAHGAGLGLNIVKNFVALHGGKVSVSNNDSGGCTFVVELPVPGRASSGKDLAAMIFDPQGRIYSFLEKPLRQLGVSCYVCKSPLIFQRTLDHAYPELIFLPSGELPPEVDRQVQQLTLGPKLTGPFLISVSMAAGDSQQQNYFQTLQLPIVDTEIQCLVADVIQRLNERYRDGL